MSSIRAVYTAAPNFPASDQHPDAVRYQIGPYWVDAIGAAPTLDAVTAFISPVPAISKRQALTFLLSMGKTEADVVNAINTIADSNAKAQALIDWQYPDKPFPRSNPMFDMLGPALGIANPAQMDAAFTAAAKL